MKTFDGLMYDFEASPCGYNLIEVCNNTYNLNDTNDICHVSYADSVALDHNAHQHSLFL